MLQYVLLAAHLFLHSRTERKHHCAVIYRVAESIDAGNGSNDYYVAPFGKSGCCGMAEFFDFVVDIACFFNISIESIKECQDELSKLRTLLFAWDECHNEEGLAIEPLGGTGYDKSYFWGDFINSVYPDGTEAYNYRKSILGDDN